jgi:flagellar biosynthesis regulator FlaF
MSKPADKDESRSFRLMLQAIDSLTEAAGHLRSAGKVERMRDVDKLCQAIVSDIGRIQNQVYEQLSASTVES